MRTDWIITNITPEITPAKKISCEGFSIFVDEKTNVYQSGDLTILIDGFLLPRFDYREVFPLRKNAELVAYLYKEYGERFIEYLKGSFNLVIVKSGKAFIYNDHIGLKKFFTFEKNGEFFISNNIHCITENIAVEPSAKGIATHSLFHHFIGGVTLFENVSSSPNASKVIISNKLEKTTYWNYKELASLKKEYVSFDNFADKITHITKGYLDYIGSRNISMTLTGGMDSRTILAILLKLGYKPNTFTFGSKVSADVEVAKKITNSFKLNFNNYTEDNPTGDWYDSLTDEIVGMGNPLIHIHRAHRLDAIKKELAQNPGVKVLFTGAMGGEGIRGLHYDNLIVTNFVKRVHEGETADIAGEVLTEYFVKENAVSQEQIGEVMGNVDFFSDDRKMNEYFVLYELVASLHDYQDLSIYQNKLPYVISVFLDIDYLEMLFSSHYSLFDKDNLTGNQLKRLNIPEVHCNLIDKIYRPLSKFQFVNGFSPREFLLNKYYYLFLRAVRKKMGKKYPPNFPYKEWFHDFIGKNYENLNPALNKIMNIEKAKNMFEAGNHKTVEGYWHKFTNIVMYSKHLNKSKR